MFTGIVEEIGTVRDVVKGSLSGSIRIDCRRVLEGTIVGDSIAVNGVCLTVTAADSSGFTADVMPETFRRSSLGALKAGSMVDLERAMAAGGRFGGHIVSGHIDGTGIIDEFRKEKNAVWVKIHTNSQIMSLIVEKGSICIDGISLTVAGLGTDYFEVSLIPHTGRETVLLKKRQGDMVNLENDIVGKYVKRLLSAGGIGITDKESGQDEPGADSGITEEFLRQHGF